MFLYFQPAERTNLPVQAASVFPSQASVMDAQTVATVVTRVTVVSVSNISVCELVSVGLFIDLFWLKWSKNPNREENWCPEMHHCLLVETVFWSIHRIWWNIFLFKWYKNSRNLVSVVHKRMNCIGEPQTWKNIDCHLHISIYILDHDTKFMGSVTSITLLLRDRLVYIAWNLGWNMMLVIIL